jgi:hypothetical protein
VRQIFVEGDHSEGANVSSSPRLGIMFSVHKAWWSCSGGRRSGAIGSWRSSSNALWACAEIVARLAACATAAHGHEVRTVDAELRPLWGAVARVPGARRRASRPGRSLELGSGSSFGHLPVLDLVCYLVSFPQPQAVLTQNAVALADDANTGSYSTSTVAIFMQNTGSYSTSTSSTGVVHTIHSALSTGLPYVFSFMFILKKW